MESERDVLGHVRASQLVQVAGAPIGNWKRWTPDGKVTELEDYDAHTTNKSTDIVDPQAIPPLASAAEAEGEGTE